MRVCWKGTTRVYPPEEWAERHGYSYRRVDWTPEMISAFRAKYYRSNPVRKRVRKLV